MSILFAILIFSFLIFIHELGHFAAAKLSGVQVNEFSMFMGPAIFKKQVGETLYAIRCIPIGGYCAMEGEDGESDNPRAFGRAVWWKPAWPAMPRMWSLTAPEASPSTWPAEMRWQI